MAVTKKERAVIEAALKWAYCPSAGGYADGPATEDTCEDLTIAVGNLTGLSPHDLDEAFAQRREVVERKGGFIWWPTVKEVNAKLKRKTVYRIRKE